MRVISVYPFGKLTEHFCVLSLAGKTSFQPSRIHWCLLIIPFCCLQWLWLHAGSWHGKKHRWLALGIQGESLAFIHHNIKIITGVWILYVHCVKGEQWKDFLPSDRSGTWCLGEIFLQDKWQISVGEIVQQPGQVLMFLLPEGTFGMVATAPRPPQTENLKVKLSL